MAPYKNCILESSKEIGLNKVGCRTKPYLQAFSFPEWLNLKKPVVYNSCAGNEEAAMRYRYMKDTPNMNLDMPVFEECFAELIAKLEQHGPITPLSMPEFLETKKGALYKRYREAAEAVFRDGLDLQRDSKITPFIKNEKYFEDGKFPRLVYSRSPKFGCLWARFILPIEHALTKLPEVMKGKNFIERGKAFGDLVYCPGKAFCENDMSQFEASQRAQLFDLVQYRMLLYFYEMFKKYWKDLYEEHLTKFGWTMMGLFYYLFGLMASGDFETGCFNTIANWLGCRYFEKKNDFGNCNFIVDGDDSVIQCPIKPKKLINTFEDFGFQAKLIYKEGYQNVDFCSSRFIQIRPGVFYQVQDLRKLLSSIPYMINTNFDNHLADYYGSLGYMYKVLYAGIPVYQDLAAFLQTASSNYVSTKMLSTVHYGAFSAFQNSSCLGQVDPLLSSLDISMAFGFSLVELEQLTLWFRSSHLSFDAEHSKPYKSRDRTVKFEVPVEFLDTYVIHGVPHSRPKWYG